MFSPGLKSRSLYSLWIVRVHTLSGRGFRNFLSLETFSDLSGCYFLWITWDSCSRRLLPGRTCGTEAEVPVLTACAAGRAARPGRHPRVTERRFPHSRTYANSILDHVQNPSLKSCLRHVVVELRGDVCCEVQSQRSLSGSSPLPTNAPSLSVSQVFATLPLKDIS